MACNDTDGSLAQAQAGPFVRLMALAHRLKTDRMLSTLAWPFETGDQRVRQDH